MLIKIERKLNGKTTYKCDRCNKKCINTRQNIECISIAKSIDKDGYKTWKKQYDLCKKCYAALVRGIEKK